MGPPWSPIGPYRIMYICVCVRACADRVLQAVLFIDVAYVVGGRMGVESAFLSSRYRLDPTPQSIAPYEYKPFPPLLGLLEGPTKM